MGIMGPYRRRILRIPGRPLRRVLATLPKDCTK